MLRSFSRGRRWVAPAERLTGGMRSQPSALAILEQKSLSPNMGNVSSFTTKSVSSALRVGRSDDGFLSCLVLNRPEKRNALSRQLVSQLKEAVEEEANNKNCRALILTTSTPGVFCAGADLKERAEMSEKDVEDFVNSLRDFTMELSQLPMPTIACIEGAAFGGGLEIPLACDFRVTTPDSRLALPETRLGIIPGAGGTQRLPRLIGQSAAKFLILTGHSLTGAEALQWGVVDFVSSINDSWIPQSEEKDSSDDSFWLANVISQDGGAADSTVLDKYPATTTGLALARYLCQPAPLAVRAAKRSIAAGSGSIPHASLESPSSSLLNAMKVEQECYRTILPTNDRKEALAAFKEKRRPNFKGN